MDRVCPIEGIYGLMQAMDKIGGLFGCDLLVDKEEFITSPSTDHIALTDACGKDIRKVDQHQVTTLVAAGIVDLFEIVDIHQRYHASASGLCLLDRIIEILFHGIPVEQTGQAVAFCQYLEFVHHLVFFQTVVGQVLEQSIVGKNKNTKVDYR